MNHIPVEFMTELYEAFLNIPDKETAENFLNDLCLRISKITRNPKPPKIISPVVVRLSSTLS